MPGKIVWQRGDVLVKDITDSLPKVLISGIETSELNYRIRQRVAQIRDKVNNKQINSLVLIGRIKIFGDLDNDGTPEFLWEHITETPDTLYGWQELLRISSKNEFNYTIFFSVL